MVFRSWAAFLVYRSDVQMGRAATPLWIMRLVLPFSVIACNIGQRRELDQRSLPIRELCDQKKSVGADFYLLPFTALESEAG
jgi:hypothetical protein